MRTTIGAFVFIFFLLSYVVGCAHSTTPESMDRLPYVLKARVVRGDLGDADALSITSLHGDSKEYRAGATYMVRGQYRLQSREEAHLTQWCANGWVQAVDGDDANSQHGGSLRVTLGEGEFSFFFTVKEVGDLHISFYPVEGGESFGSLYYIPVEHQ